MRKDVRLGFAVGGGLLAVIIVGIIIGHHNSKKKDQVTLEQGKPNAGSNADQNEPLDVTAPPARNEQATVPSQPDRKADEGGAAKRQQSEAGEDKTADKQWDLLFASTAEDPLKPEQANYNTRRNDRGSDSTASAAPDSQAPFSANNPPTARRGSSSDDSSPTTRPASNVPLTHTVRQGETLSGIAKSYYGRSTAYQAILKANPGLDPQKMRPGLRINLPPTSEVKTDVRPDGRPETGGTRRSSPVVDPSRQYVVVSGDTLSHIALKLYGRRDRANDLYIANREVIGPDSARLKPGMVLKLPELPTPSTSAR